MTPLAEIQAERTNLADWLWENEGEVPEAEAAAARARMRRLNRLFAEAEASTLADCLAKARFLEGYFQDDPDYARIHRIAATLVEGLERIVAEDGVGRLPAARTAMLAAG